MSISTVLSEDLQNRTDLEEIKTFFRKTKSFIDRFHQLRKLRSHCFVGLMENHLTREWIQENKNREASDAPNKIMIRKDCISDLSYLTQSSRRTIERGVSAFFKKNYKLTNCSFYSRNWLVFKIPSPKDEKKFHTRHKRYLRRKLLSQNKIEKLENENTTQSQNGQKKKKEKKMIKKKKNKMKKKNKKEFMCKSGNEIKVPQKKMLELEMDGNLVNRKRKQPTHEVIQRPPIDFSENTISQKQQLKRKNHWNYGILKIDLFPSINTGQSNWLQHIENEFGLKC
ncbi:hypothetical protein M0812_17526 [Anaeramoeba flamelloides]|uniref:Uncharacterized protein n=1 Tax=Anaeramoeba flamelloides TaxID=1746091 RepID=A0AAV7Z9G3_9EUKA|nr:hypothetical protein M0812_17526 [Anaeramoeba flamelloides]